MKKIHLANGDFISVDNEREPKSINIKEPDGAPSKNIELVLFAAGLVCGVLLNAYVNKHMQKEEVKEISDNLNQKQPII